MLINIGDKIKYWVIVKLEFEDTLKEIYTVRDSRKRKADYFMIIIKSTDAEHSYNFDAFSENDALIYDIPDYSYRDSHEFPKLYDYGDKSNGYEFQYFVCEKLGRNLMQIFYDNNRSISMDTLCKYAYKMFNMLHVVNSYDENFTHLCPYDFYEELKDRNPRFILVNQCASEQNMTSFIKKFDSISVMNGNPPTIIDNAISICYILYYLYTGSLPWMTTTRSTSEIAQKIQFNKSSLSHNEPTELVILHDYLVQFTLDRDLKYDFKEIGNIFKCSLQKHKSESNSLMSPDSSFYDTPSRQSSYNDTKVHTSKHEKLLEEISSISLDSSTYVTPVQSAIKKRKESSDDEWQSLSVETSIISPESSPMTTPVLSANKETSLLSQTLENASKRQVENAQKITAVLFPDVDKVNIELPKVQTEKRDHSEIHKDMIVNDEDEKNGIEEDNDDNDDNDDETSRKRRRIWNDVKALILHPALITSLIVFTKYVFDQL